MSSLLAHETPATRGLTAVVAILSNATSLEADHQNEVDRLRERLAIRRIDQVQSDMKLLEGLLADHERDARHLTTCDAMLLAGTKRRVATMRTEIQDLRGALRPIGGGELAERAEAAAARLVRQLHEVRRVLERGTRQMPVAEAA